MKQKLNSEQQQEHAVEQKVESQAAKEFSTAEELLRFDAAQTTVPPGVAQRLQKSTGSAPAPNRSWWRRFFGGNQ